MYIDTHNKQVEDDYEKRKAAHDASRARSRSKSPPRRGKKKGQEYICGCFVEQGSTCKCCVGPFTNAQRPILRAEFEEYLSVQSGQARPTVSNQYSSGNFFNFLVDSTIAVRFSVLPTDTHSFFNLEYAFI